MKTMMILVSAVLSVQSGTAQQKPMPELNVVPSVDLQRYMGTWYEIARLPNWFQKACVGDVTATYTLDGDGIEVVNRCRQENGEMKEAKGRARRASNDEPNSKLEVRFAPAVLSWLPFVWGDYWIIDLAPDYSYVVIGEPARKYLWILSRAQHMDDHVWAGICERIREQGYDPTLLVKTNQSTQVLK